jgi:hypothetical protein
MKNLATRIECSTFHQQACTKSPALEPIGCSFTEWRFGETKQLSVDLGIDKGGACDLRSADARKPSVGRRLLPGRLVFSRSLLGQSEGLRAGVSYHTRREHYSVDMLTRHLQALFRRESHRTVSQRQVDSTRATRSDSRGRLDARGGTSVREQHLEVTECNYKLLP